MSKSSIELFKSFFVQPFLHMLCDLLIVKVEESEKNVAIWSDFGLMIKHSVTFMLRFAFSR